MYDMSKHTLNTFYMIQGHTWEVCGLNETFLWRQWTEVFIIQIVVELFLF